MGSKLSHTLLDLGFFSALGTSEHPGGHLGEVYVDRKTPNTRDYNNGVLVVYDEVGRPWILPGEDVTPEMRTALEPFSLTRGAYVPHSNDGGFFVHEVVKKLRLAA